MTFELPLNVGLALTAEAARRGMAPDALASELILSQLPVVSSSSDATSEPTPDGDLRATMLEKWKAHFDSLPPPSDEPRPEWLRADNVSEAFGKILEEKRRQGRL